MPSKNMQAARAWLPALAGMTCLGLGAGLIGLFGFFVEPLSQEFGVGVATLNIAPVALLLVPGIIAPLVGRLVDVWPIRRMILGGSALALLSLLAISFSSSLLQAGIGFLCFSIGITFYGPVVINGLMVKLYPGQEGRALAIAALGISIASMTLPPAMGAALQIVEWREALAVMSIVLLAIVWLWVLLGIPADAGAVADSPQAKVDREIYRRAEFWMVGITVALTLNVMVILTICYPPLLASRGFTAVEAGLFLAVGGAGGALGKLTVAVLADKLRPHTRWFAAAILLVKLVGLILLLMTDVTYLIVVSVAMMGFSGGAFLPMHPYLNSRYFKADIIGQVNGAQGPLFLPLGLVGAPLAGYVFDQTGSYTLVLVGLALILLLAILSVLALPRSRF
ncbi:MFS transporter [Halieaceae bacterium IMCC8485]|uniref:MFS transporter n=1 Tax=Candidatus Seongchinamella marina TaxID=2518990 RepID=A0ABT3SXH0_9GAMM|nr:MFS transporter [Candidatus Seongchinamella marina]MCX2973964.1 MFS transporter [Candidatus Seongchinamella marina]